MKSKLWLFLLLIGMIPFIIPIVLAFYTVSVQSFNFIDYIFLYSFLYWPTYIIGILFIIIAFIIRKKSH